MIKHIVGVIMGITCIFLFQLCASALEIQKLPVEYDRDTKPLADVFVLEKNVNLRANLTIHNNKYLVIPEGKRLILNSDKAITVNGGIYVECGGSLIINNGTLSVSGGTVVSKGNIEIKDKGELITENDGLFLALKDGKMKQMGKIAEKNGAVICIGKYSGKGNFNSEILYAVAKTVNIFDGRTTVDIYYCDEANALLPKMNFSNDQTNPAGNMRISYVTFLCSNNKSFEIIFNSGVASGIYSVGGMRLSDR